MNRILHHPQNARRILRITADTMLLVSQEGVCIDIDTHSDLWFLKEELLLGKNVFDLLPLHTREKLVPTFRSVVDEQKTVSRNYRLELPDGTYYFKCIMHPYDDMVLCQYRDITARSNVKLQLERTNRELKAIQKAAQIGRWKYASNERIFYYQGYTDILCSEELQSIPIDRYCELVVEEAKAVFAQWLENNERQPDENGASYRISHKGSIYYLQIQTCVREEQPDGTYYIEGYIQNVTDIQRHRNDINTLTHAIDNAKESIFAAREDGTLIFTNRLFRQNHRIQGDRELSSYKIYELAGDMSGSNAWQRRCEQTKEKNYTDFIAYHPVPDNTEIQAFEGTMYHVTSDEGEVSYWSFTHDITERLRYESQIKRLNRIMDTTMKNLPAGIVVKDINNDFRYVYRNREAYTQEAYNRKASDQEASDRKISDQEASDHGSYSQGSSSRKISNQEVSTENAIGKNDFDYYPPELAEQKRKEDMEIAATGTGKHWILEGKDENGNLLILDKQKIKVDSKDFSPVIISIEWDITQLELMKRELQASKEKAETSDKQKSAFLANMSHEIRTPLNAIVGFSRIIAESEDADERKAYYEIVDANNERLLQLINEILDLSKIESGIVEFSSGPVKLHKLCKEIYDAHIFRTPDGVELIYEPSDEILVIDSDKNRIFQVISNLIGNAFKFTTQGKVSYGYRRKGDGIEFHVSDTGIGIEAGKLDKVFERFVKMNSFAQGTGLGMSICKTIIERLGGTISASSEMGKGTTFTFTLPEKQEETADKHADIHKSGVNAPTYAQKENNASLSGEEHQGSEQPHDSSKPGLPTILVAEDTDSNYILVRAILGKSYHLERAKDGMEAVTMFEELHPDLILMDMKMPNLDGLDATKIIRELSPKIPIIALTAYAYECDRQAALKAGCNEFLTKPYKQEELKEVIERHLEEKDVQKQK